MIEYKSDDDDPYLLSVNERNKSSRLENVNSSDFSDSEEEFEDLVFPPNAIIQLIDNVNPNETIKDKVNKMKYLNDTIANCKEDDFQMLIEGDIHQFLISSFFNAVDPELFQYTVKCIETWVLNIHCPSESFADIDFMNAILFAATSYTKESEYGLQYTELSQISTEQRLSLIKIFRQVISRNDGMHEEYPREAFFSRCVNAFNRERERSEPIPKVIEAILSLIEFFFDRKFESPLLLSEVMPLESVIMPLVQEDILKIDSLYTTMLNIAQRFFCYSKDFASFFLENIDMNEVIHHAINGDNKKKCDLIHMIRTCSESNTGNFFDSMLQTWKWNNFTDFLKSSDSNLFKISMKDFLFYFIKENPIILNGEEFEDFITYLIEIFDNSQNDVKVPIIMILTFSMQFDNKKLNFHLLEQGIIEKCSLFLDQDDEVILLILQSIDYLCKNFVSEPDNMSQLIDNMNECDMIITIDNLQNSDNDDIAQIATHIITTYMAKEN